MMAFLLRANIFGFKQQRQTAGRLGESLGDWGLGHWIALNAKLDDE